MFGQQGEVSTTQRAAAVRVARRVHRFRACGLRDGVGCLRGDVRVRPKCVGGVGAVRACRPLRRGRGALLGRGGDLDGDGKRDFVTANPSGTVSVLRGNGDGTFAAATSFYVGSSPKSVTVGDFNADGKPDLVTANWEGDQVAVMLGNGDGTFGAADRSFVGSGPVSVAVGDLNGDAKPDLATANMDSADVSGAVRLPGQGTNVDGMRLARDVRIPLARPLRAPRPDKRVGITAPDVRPSTALGVW